VDCEKFDRIVLDLLYDELDELTGAAARRHMEHCVRCRGIGSELRATRIVGSLPLVDPPEGLELAIFAAERQMAELLPLRKRLGRALSLLAGYAMRPQLAMAALLMLMIGSSLLFLRAQPGDREHVLVTERGVPEGDSDSVALLPKKVDALVSEDLRAGARAKSSADDTSARRDRAQDSKLEARPSTGAAAATNSALPAEGPGGPVVGGEIDATAGDTDASYDAAMAAYRDGRYSEAERRFAEIAGGGGEHAPRAALLEVQALRMVSGCPAAAPRFESVHARYPGPIGNDAAWQAGECFRSLGDLARARRDYRDLALDPNYKTRANDAIAELTLRKANQEAEVRTKPAAPASSAPGKNKAP
jgi:hypothetical protein